MQKCLFNVETIGYTIDEAAGLLNVSTATIRNWIKVGSIETVKKGVVSKESFSSYIDDAVGNGKLAARANKSLKSSNKHTKLLEDISHIITSNCPDQMGSIYEESLSESYRNIEGIYYTPTAIVSDMIQGDIDCTTTFLDPCCGSGNFIIEAISKGVNPSNVHGYDKDPNAVKITKERIKRKFGMDAVNIKVADFFQEVDLLSDRKEKFDYIFTNPPWGKKFSKLEKEKIMQRCGLVGNLDSAALFLLASFRVLKEGGRLGFLVQDAFFNIAAYEQIRLLMLEKRILRLIDYGRPFKGLMARANAFILDNCKPNENDVVRCEVLGNVNNRSQSSFLMTPKRILNFGSDDEDCKVIERLFCVEHKTLRDNAKWGLGIVTGNNKKYCSDQRLEDYLPVYRGADITKQGMKRASLYISDQFNKFQQVAPIELYQAKEKIIYKFIASKPVFCYDDQQRFVLNSANIIIPTQALGVSMRRLVDLFNSEIIGWMFDKVFATHKILRSDIEYLPIHYAYFDYFEQFNEDDYLNYLKIYKTKDGTFRIKI